MADIDKDVKINVKGDTRDINAKLEQTGQKGQQMGDKVKQGADKGASGLDKMGNAAQGAKTDMAAVAVSIQAMTAQIAGMAQQVLDFETKVLALQKTAVGMESQQIALRRMQEDLNLAVQEGTISQRDYQRAVEDMEIAFKNVVLEEQVVAAETRKLTGEYVTFGINAAGTAGQIGIAMAAMGISSKAALASMVVGIKGVSAAMWTIAKHPVFLIITAGILAWELGLKSIVENLTGIDDLGIFSNLEKAFMGLTEGPGSMKEIDAQTQEFSNTIQETTPFIVRETEALDGLSVSAGNTTNEINKLTSAQERLKRSGGFSAGPGKPLSAVINEEANRIEIATSRTLAAASLHSALRNAGITGSVFGRNVSGSNERGLADFVRTFRDSSFGPSGTGFFGSQSTARIQGQSPAERFFRGARVNLPDSSRVSGLSTDGRRSSSFAGRSLTRSRARGSRKTTNIGERIRALGRQLDANPVHRALVELTGIGPGFRFPVFGNNAGLDQREKDQRILDEFERQRKATKRRQLAAFREMREEEGIVEARGINALKFLKLRGTPGGFKEIRGVIDFQKRAGQQVTGTTV